MEQYLFASKKLWSQVISRPFKFFFLTACWEAQKQILVGDSSIFGNTRTFFSSLSMLIRIIVMYVVKIETDDYAGVFCGSLMAHGPRHKAATPKDYQVLIKVAWQQNYGAQKILGHRIKMCVQYGSTLSGLVINWSFLWQPFNIRVNMKIDLSKIINIFYYIFANSPLCIT